METRGLSEGLPRGESTVAVLVVGLLPSCGAGVVAVAASSGSSGGGTTPALDAFRVESPKVSPSLLILDASQAVRVGLFYDLGQGPKAMTELEDAAGNAIAGNEVDLPASGEITFSWNFASELDGKEFIPGVKLIAMRGGTPISGGELTLGLGNDPPEILSIQPVVDASGETAGNVEVSLGVSDSSSDLVSIRVDWRRSSDAPDDWKTATVGGVPDTVGTSPNGASFSFFWKTDADGLGSADDDFLLRVEADDGALDDGEAVGIGRLVSPSFRVDNNAAPIAQLDSGPLVLNPDERRGIPIPFRVIDEEGDLVEVIFQWRREGGEFPSLDRDGDGTVESAEVDEILADPILRRERHVCTPFPHYARGRVVPIDEDTVRLPELASSESWILAGGIEGKTLELLRPSSIPAPIRPTWRSNPLVSPIAALPVGDGLTALVLDVPGNGRLREIELATGVVVREIAAFGQGIPSAMALERGGSAVLVALDDAGTWRIERVELATGAVTELAVSDGSEPAPVRAIASLGTSVAVLTAGSALFQLDYRAPLVPELGKLLTGLASPWGVAVDPLSPDRLYLAERDANRVLAVELDSHGKVPVVVKTGAMQVGALDAPQGLALERNGSRLLIATSAPGGGRQLLGLDPGATGGSLSFPIGDPTAAEIGSVACGPDQLRFVCLPAASELLVAGGIEQRRSIVARSAASQDVSLDSALDPPVEPGRFWRIRTEPLPLRASAQGAPGRFLWDSTEATGLVFVRATARDDELGPSADGTAAKRVLAGVEVEPFLLGGPGTTDLPSAVAAADLDGDGDLDLVSANSVRDDLTIFFQVEAGSFGIPVVLGGTGTTDRPSAVAAADLDGDGDLDLVSAIEGRRNLTIFFQVAPGNFAGTPLVLGGPGTTDRPGAVTAADLDGDGDLDLVSGNRLGGNLTIFFQHAPGSFDPSPLVLGDSGTTDGRTVAAGDMDGDGDVDLVSSNSSSDDLKIFFQLAPGSFASAPLVLGGPGMTDEPRGVTAADLDADGDLDLVSPVSDNGNLVVFHQLAPGIFSETPVVLGGLGGHSALLSVTAVDSDADGDLDIVGTAGSSDRVIVFPQLQPGRFAEAPFVLGDSGTPGEARAIAFADLDGNGVLDLVRASDSTLKVHLQRFYRSAGPAVVVGRGSALTPRSVAACDLDGDGDLDLVSANESGHNLTAFLQKTPGSFGADPLVLSEPGTTVGVLSVAPADLDGDGDQDLASLVRTGRLVVFFQSSSGSFADPPLVLENPGRGFSVSVADMDGDGDLDLVSAIFDGLTIHHQLSPGSFAGSPLVLGDSETTDVPQSVATADLDADGDVDLVSANIDGNDLTVFLKTSPSSFSSFSLGGPGITVSPASITAEDLDGDGDLDLASANYNGNNLTAFFQLAPGSFASTPLTLGGPTTTNRPISVTAADFDGDGDQDLLSANDSGDNLTVFFQLAPGAFASTPLTLGGSATTNAPSSVAVADIDGDGDQDLLSANANGNNLTVFFGGR